MALTVDDPAGTELDMQLTALRSRLENEFGPGDEVRRVIDEESRRFAGARIRSFLPILIERSVRSRLATS